MKIRPLRRTPEPRSAQKAAWHATGHVTERISENLRAPQSSERRRSRLRAGPDRGCGPGGRGFESPRSPLRKPCLRGASLTGCAEIATWRRRPRRLTALASASRRRRSIGERPAVYPERDKHGAEPCGSVFPSRPSTAAYALSTALSILSFRSSAASCALSTASSM